MRALKANTYLAKGGFKRENRDYKPSDSMLLLCDQPMFVL